MNLTKKAIEDISKLAPEYSEMLAVLTGGTPGELCIYRSGTQTHEDAAAYILRALEPNPSVDLIILGIKGDEDVKKGLAIFGNGPSADANARRAALAMQFAPILLASVACYHIAAVDALTALERGEHGAAYDILRSVLGPPDAAVGEGGQS